ncbi:hypothetical protein KR032_003414 [Drosophila birchii]|nr:hypothetical protein KR032_003414 [Drosophila birchii]
MDEEQKKRRMMLTCLKENAKNVAREYNIMEQRYCEIVTPFINAHEWLNKLIDQNKFREYQVAFRQVYKAVRETREYLIGVEKVLLQMKKIAACLRRYEDPSEGVTMANFLEMLNSLGDN